jgi:hypothetical protein
MKGGAAFPSSFYARFVDVKTRNSRVPFADQPFKVPKAVRVVQIVQIDS